MYGNAKAGAKLQQMLAMGASKPWPEALKAISGEERIDGGALLDYFAPLKTWLDPERCLCSRSQEVKSQHQRSRQTLYLSDSPRLASPQRMMKHPD
jgi:hypothetical protein